MLSPKIETERLILRRYKETDIDAIYDIITDKRLSTYIKYPELTKEQELECIKEWIKEADDSKYERWVIERKEDESRTYRILKGMPEKTAYGLDLYTKVFG